MYALVIYKLLRVSLMSQVAETLAKNVLTAPGTEVKVLSSSQVGGDLRDPYAQHSHRSLSIFIFMDGSYPVDIDIKPKSELLPRCKAYTSPEYIACIVSISLLCHIQREDDKGRKYYEFEFTASKGFTRHQLAVVAVANGKFYTLTTGCSERRWGRMKEKLETTIKSFSLV